ncbi:MAG: tetratricopeptide repeat protein [Gammaproteobacteria bacterium]|nr:tetratricopeptide repeat protein [Gammaproteobacteria bacterium]
MKIINMLCLSLILAGCQIQPPALKTKLSDLRLAEIAHHSGDIRTAIGLYQSLLLKKPDDHSVLLNLSQAYRQIQQPELARHYIDQLLTLKPSNMHAWRELGLIQLDQQDYTNAQQSLSKAQQLSPQDITSLNALGVANSWLKNYQQAHRYLIQAMALAPGNIKFKNNLALNHILQQQYQAAIKLLYPLYQQQQSSVKIRQNLALALVMSDNETLARKVLAQDLNQLQVQQNIDYYHQLKQQDRANDVL